MRSTGRPFDVDVAVQVPHGALRLHVMGERGARREPATRDDIDRMATIARDAVAAGALGFSTSRTLNHRTSRGEPTPTLTAEADELVGIAEAIGTTGQGVLQVVSDFGDVEGEFGIFRQMAEASGRPLSFSLLQVRGRTWRTLLDLLTQANADGVTDDGPGRTARGGCAVRSAVHVESAAREPGVSRDQRSTTRRPGGRAS